MIDSLYIAATGMNAQQLNVDTISNNLANVNTTAFKKNRVNFEDLMYREVVRANQLLGSGDNAHRLGAGVAIAHADKIFAVGDFKKTDQPLDIAIRGMGFLQIQLPDGSHAYTRGGSLQIGKDGFLSTSDGHILQPGLQVPADASAITIEPAGRVLAQLPNESEPSQIGELELVTFANPEALKPLGENLYAATERSGEAIAAGPGEQNVGTLAQGFLEASNVKMVDEFINLIVAQRAYEVSSKAIQASDEMLGIVNNLRR
jgi:flagellar basal-body rod protein FlgG